MKFFAILACAMPLTISAFAPMKTTARKQTNLAMVSRRDALFVGAGALAGVVGAPNPSAARTANPVFEGEVNFEPSQQPTGDKIDLNGAFVGDYKQFPGMFPHAAGKIASNGPYESVKDIYKIEGLTANDVKMFKKYEKEFAVLPPGRMFDERINQRFST